MPGTDGSMPGMDGRMDGTMAGWTDGWPRGQIRACLMPYYGGFRMAADCS